MPLNFRPMSGTFRISTRTLVAAVSSHAHIQTAHLHVLRPGALTKNNVQHTARAVPTILHLLCDFAYVPNG